VVADGAEAGKPSATLGGGSRRGPGGLDSSWRRN